MIFNILVSNTDDHLRNHGFLYQGPHGWRLSPAYDMNPTPTYIRPRILSTAINLDGDQDASIESAREVADYFGLTPSDAIEVEREVGTAVASWRSVAAEFGIVGDDLDRMSSAFEHEDLKMVTR